MKMDFNKEEQIKYRENLINDYRKDYPNNLEKIKENYTLLKSENKGNEFLSGNIGHVWAIVAILIAFSICDINLQRLYKFLGENNYTLFSIITKVSLGALGIIFLYWGRNARIKLQKNIIEMDVIEDIYPHIKK